MTMHHLLTRRRFLQGAGVSLALPLLESMHRVFADHTPRVPPQRMLLISNNLAKHCIAYFFLRNLADNRINDVKVFT